MTHKPLDFPKVEELRKHMLINVEDWVKILGASRMTYYKWVTGTARPRPRRETVVRGKLKVLLTIMANGWPEPDIKGFDASTRAAKLLALIDQPQ